MQRRGGPGHGSWFDWHAYPRAIHRGLDHVRLRVDVSFRNGHVAMPGKVGQRPRVHYAVPRASGMWAVACTGETAERRSASDPFSCHPSLPLHAFSVRFS
jgi:hypothetical protein